MCGRYNFTVEESDEIKEILEKLNEKFHGNFIKNGEVFPTDQIPVLISQNKNITPVLSKWGFPRYDKKGIIINARAESVFEKKTFRDSLTDRRCIIPSTGFYEWDSAKKKFLLRMNGTNSLYMAGLYILSGDEIHYVILTTKANASMREIHNRMPLVLSKKDIGPWLFDHSITGDILKKEPPQLIKLPVQGR